MESQMTDKKPNNNDIIKALDICSKSTNGCSHSKYTCEYDFHSYNGNYSILEEQ